MTVENRETARYAITDVVTNGTCVGCGGCGVATGGKVTIGLNQIGYYEASLDGVRGHDLELADAVCPFSDNSPDEDQISSEVFSDMPGDFAVGRFLGLYAGQIRDENRLVGSSSGGLTSWLIEQLLTSGKVDGVIHVGGTDSGALFGYLVSRSAEEVLANRKSMYYSTTYADVVNSVRGDGRRYAFVGVPCYVRSLRAVVRHDSVLKEQIRYFVGIVCGHMKSTGYAESLAWQMGVAPDELETVDFRVKDPKKSAKHYAFGAKARSDSELRIAPPGTLMGANWGHAVFQLNACNYCDDIYGETADIVLGDAWLPKYEADWRGTNVIITRSSELDELLKSAAADGTTELEEISLDSVVKAQAGNYRHRREGLAVRLADDECAGRPHPRKRVEPSYDVVKKRRISVIRRRRELSDRSHDAFRAAKLSGNLEQYLDEMRPVIDRYDRSSRLPLRTRAWRKLKREAWKRLRR